MQDTKFCEHYVPQEVISRNNTLNIHYNLESARPDNNFWLSWTTLGCGGIILKNDTDMIVNKADFVSDFEERQCKWVIKAPLGFVIRIDIEVAYFVGDPNQRAACDDPSKLKRFSSHDGIEFYAGTDNSSGIPQKVYCNVIHNETYVSPTNEVFAYMRLSPQNIMGEKNNDSLRAKVTFVKLNLSSEYTCGGVIERKF